MISVSLLNPPAQATYWLPVFYDMSHEAFHPGQYLRINEVWGLSIANDGYLDFRVSVYDTEYALLVSRFLGDVFVRDGAQYAYDWIADRWQKVEALPPVEPPPEPPEPEREEKKTPVGKILIGAGTAIVLTAALRKRRASS